MFEQFRYSDTDPLARDRIHEIHLAATEVRTTPRANGGRANLVLRTRTLIGRRLISLGNALAGQHA